ncbi:MAG TPA: CAP domain-containing protein [Aggregatilineaceae bacterium]|nr:CAP domain-containing protein [Aggregatilineaceae bacterium]
MHTYRLVFFALFVVTLIPLPTVSAQQSTDLVATLTAALNAWRIANDRWPFQTNSTLQALAVDQAQYLLSLPALPDDMHAGRNGENVRERAQYPQFDWPNYGRAEQIAVGEIAYVGANIAAALRFWDQSGIHHRTVMNFAYREIGIAVLPHPFGFLFIVVLGSRPNVLPVLADPLHDLLYLSNERFQGAPQLKGAIRNVTKIMFQDPNGRSFSSSWLPWQASIPIPPEAGHDFYVLFSDGESQMQTHVHLAGTADIVLLPDTLPYVLNQPTPVAVIPTPTFQASAVPPPAPVAQTVPTATPTPAISDESFELLIVYDRRSLALVNVDSHPIDVTGLDLEYGTSHLPATRWQQPWLSFPLDAMPPSSCLQVWSWLEPSDLPQPSICTAYSSTIQADPKQLFWTASSFTVFLAG